MKTEKIRESGWYWVLYPEDPKFKNGKEWMIGQYHEYSQNWFVLGWPQKDRDFLQIGSKIECPY